MTCKKCGCKNFIGLYRVTETKSVVACTDCMMPHFVEKE